MDIRHLLGYLGVLPFIASLFFLSSTSSIPVKTSPPIFVIYSIAILSFLAGTLWQANTDSKRTAIISNLLCLFAVASIFLPSQIGLLWLGFGYFSIWYAERRLRQSNTISYLDTYHTLRSRLTVIVIFLHLLASLMLLEF